MDAGSAWIGCGSIGFVPLWTMVVAGQVGEVFVELALFSIFIDTLLSDCPCFVHSLQVMTNVISETMNCPSPIITHL